MGPVKNSLVGHHKLDLAAGIAALVKSAGNGDVDRSADAAVLCRAESFVTLKQRPRGSKLLASKNQEAPTRNTACRKVARPE